MVVETNQTIYAIPHAVNEPVHHRCLTAIVSSINLMITRRKLRTQHLYQMTKLRAPKLRSESAVQQSVQWTYFIYTMLTCTTLARSLCVRPSVCVHVSTRPYCIETDERIQLVFGVEASLGLSYSVL